MKEGWLGLTRQGIINRESSLAKNYPQINLQTMKMSHLDELTVFVMIPVTKEEAKKTWDEAVSEVINQKEQKAANTISNVAIQQRKEEDDDLDTEDSLDDPVQLVNLLVTLQENVPVLEALKNEKACYLVMKANTCGKNVLIKEFCVQIVSEGELDESMFT